MAEDSEITDAVRRAMATSSILHRVLRDPAFCIEFCGDDSFGSFEQIFWAKLQKVSRFPDLQLRRNSFDASEATQKFPAASKALGS